MKTPITVLIIQIIGQVTLIITYIYGYINELSWFMGHMMFHFMTQWICQKGINSENNKQTNEGKQ